MNILILISTLNYGGAEKQAILDANLLSSDNKVRLISYKSGPLEEIVSERVERLIIQKKSYLGAILKLHSLIIKTQPDVIHCSLFSSMIIGALASLHTKGKVFWHIHSHEYALPKINQLLLKYFSHFKNVKSICFVNKELIRYYLEKGYNFPPHKIKILYNNSTIVPSYERPIRSNKIIIGYTGRLVSLKRVNYLLELAQFIVSREFLDFQIRIVGDGDMRYLLEQESSQKKLQDHILFVGFQNDIGNYYRDFNIFVNPSEEECLSMALIDAGISGIPSVAFNVGGNDEIIVNSQTGYIVKTKQEFFERVFSLVLDKTMREWMGKKAIEHCFENFSEDRHLQQLENLYKEVLDD